MHNNDDVFVSLGRGMFALRKWGVKRPPYLKDFAAQVIREAGGQATIDHVASAEARKYAFKKSSITMTMSLNPTFFRRVRGDLYEVV